MSIAPSSPKIHPVSRIRGKTLMLVSAQEKDAEFILSLRTNPRKSRHLSKTSNDLEEQIRWLKKYQEEGNQAYFIIHFEHKPIGTVRLYDARGESFCWGSWILTDYAPPHGAIESALIVYSLGINHLGFKESHFDVRKENESVIRFHKKFGANCIGETSKDYLFKIGSSEISSSMRRYARYLPSGITIEH